MSTHVKKNAESSLKPLSVNRMVEDVIGCKWSLTILRLIQHGVCRPGVMERSVEGLTTKVLNERLRKLVDYGVLKRQPYPEIPPRVEYELTSFGQKFSTILDAIEALEADYQGRVPASNPSPAEPDKRARPRRARPRVRSES
jgi:DNA-binding HxlR family transcriptional regulator